MPPAFCTFSFVLERLGSISFSSFSPGSRHNTRSRLRASTQLRSFIVWIVALAAWTVQGQPLPGSFQTAPGSLAELSVHHLSSTFSTTTTIDSFDNNMELQDSALGLQFHLHNGSQNSLEPDEHIADDELATQIFQNPKKFDFSKFFSFWAFFSAEKFGFCILP